MSAPTLRQTVSQILVLAVAFPTALYTLGVVGWIAGIPLTPVLPAVALVVCLGVMVATQRSEISAVLVALLVFGGFVAGALALSAGIVDAFYDSRLYHLPSTFALREGWNPIQDPSACEWRNKFCLPHPGINHYPKAAWVVGASFYSLTGSFEAGKAGQLMTLLAAWIASARLLVSFRFLRPSLAGLLATAIAWNPIAVKQAASAYVDGWLGSALLLFCMLLLDFVFRRRRISLVLAAVSLPLLLGFKFTAVPFAALLALTAIAVAWQVRREAVGPMLRWLAASALLGLVVLGFHPYVTNVLETGNPFHPAFRTEGRSILQAMAAPEFMARDRFSKFVLANTSRSRADDWRTPEWVVPGMGWRTTPAVDDRFSGFGEPFAAALILALGVLLTTREKLVWTVVAGLLASIFVTEAGWWARLAPQTWWLPVLAAVACWLPGRRQVSRVAGVLILAILGYTVVATLVLTTVKARVSKAHVEAALTKLESTPAVIVPDRTVGVVRSAFSLTLRQRLRDAGHPIRIMPTPPRPCSFEHRFEGAVLCFQERVP